MEQQTGELVVVTGMTGAGRSTAAKELEDLGYYVVDNLPPTLLREVVRLVDESRGVEQPIAVVVDVRSGSFFQSLTANLAQGATGRFLDLVKDFLDFAIPAYIDEGKTRLTIAIGCTGGYHRSIVIAELLAEWLRGRDTGPVAVFHRELDRT